MPVKENAEHRSLLNWPSSYVRSGHGETEWGTGFQHNRCTTVACVCVCVDDCVCVCMCLSVCVCTCVHA